MFLYNVLKAGKSAVETKDGIEGIGFEVNEKGDLQIVTHMSDDEYSVPVKGKAVFKAGTWDVAYAASGIDNSAVALEDENINAYRYGEKTAFVKAHGFSSKTMTSQNMKVVGDNMRIENGALVIERVEANGAENSMDVPNVIFAPTSWEASSIKEDGGKTNIIKNEAFQKPVKMRVGAER